MKCEIGEKVQVHQRGKGYVAGVVTAKYPVRQARELNLIAGMHGKSGTVVEVQLGDKVVYKHQSTIREV